MIQTRSNFITAIMLTYVWVWVQDYGLRLSWARAPSLNARAVGGGGGGGGGGGPSCDQSNTFRVCFVTYSIHQGALSAFRFDAPLGAHYNSYYLN